MKIGHPKDFWGGVLFALIGLLFLVIAFGIKFGGTVLLPGYAMGTPARMGPAFFPFWLGLILFALGVLIATIGFRERGGPDSAFPTYHWKPILYVLGSVVMFGLILKPVGMLIAGFLVVVVSSMGNPEKFHTRDVIFLGLGLVVFCALVFVWGLKLPIPLCPDIEALQSTLKFCRG
ncbi:MAG: tripartite tricarboxylate transporter TctB family protein [Pseudomonadota bacterium]|nr:tripartite tricarboxylate transporter TctB family protein [Pseudomonadota bacterium]